MAWGPPKSTSCTSVAIIEPPQPSASAVRMAARSRATRVGFHAVVGAVQQLDDLAVDAARRDAQLVPARALLFGRAQQRERAGLPARRTGRHRAARSPAICAAIGRAATPHSAASAFSFSGLRRVAGRGAVAARTENLDNLAPVVAVRGRARGNRAGQVAGHDQVGIGAAGSDLGAFAEGIDAARPHVADVAAQPQLAEPAEGLQVVVPVPDGLRAQVPRAGQHLLRGRIGRAVVEIQGFSLQR